MRKLLFFKLRRSIPTCYLLSSKFILTIAICILAYFLTMDIILFGKARHRGPYHKAYSTTTTTTTTSPTQPSNNYFFVSSSNDDTNNHRGNTVTSASTGGVFSPLPVKKIMMADATHFIRSPIAEFIEAKLHFSEYLPFISANTISLFHCVLSVVSMKFLTHHSLFYRQFGVCIFQFRNFLDSFDGVIYRAHAKKLTYKSHYGSIGYFIDAVSDVFGGVCLMVAIGVYLLKNPPPNKNLTRCFRLASDIETTISNNSSSSSSSSGSGSGSDSSLLLPTSSPNSSFSSSLNSISISTQTKSNKYGAYDSTVFATNAVIVLSVTLCGIRLALSGLFWDRSVHAYEDLLDSIPKNDLHEHLQINTLRSTITLFIMFSWRIMCALSLQDFLLAAIFIDKIWEFIVKTQYLGWIMLIVLILLTELHVSEIRSILMQAANHNFKVA